MLESHEHKHAVHEFDGIVENRASTPPVYFTVLFYGLIVWGAVFIGWFLLSGWSSHGEFAGKMAEHGGQPAASQTAAPAAEAAATNGAELFAANCAGCHGAKGEGGFGPDLTASSFKYGRTADAVRASITEGRAQNMPAFNGRLTQGEIATLTAYVLNL